MTGQGVQALVVFVAQHDERMRVAEHRGELLERRSQDRFEIAAGGELLGEIRHARERVRGVLDADPRCAHNRPAVDDAVHVDAAQLESDRVQPHAHFVEQRSGRLGALEREVEAV